MRKVVSVRKRGLLAQPESDCWVAAHQNYDNRQPEATSSPKLCAETPSHESLQLRTSREAALNRNNVLVYFRACAKLEAVWCCWIDDVRLFLMADVISLKSRANKPAEQYLSKHRAFQDTWRFA